MRPRPPADADVLRQIGTSVAATAPFGVLMNIFKANIRISVAVFIFFEFVFISTLSLPALRKNGRHAPRS